MQPARARPASLPTNLVANSVQVMIRAVNPQGPSREFAGVTFDFGNSGSIPTGATGSVPRPRAFGSAPTAVADLPIERHGVGVPNPWHPTKPDPPKLKVTPGVRLGRVEKVGHQASGDPGKTNPMTEFPPLRRPKHPGAERSQLTRTRSENCLAKRTQCLGRHLGETNPTPRIIARRNEPNQAVSQPGETNPTPRTIAWRNEPNGTQPAIVPPVASRLSP